MPYDATDRFTPQLSLSELHMLTCGLFPAPDKNGAAFRYYPATVMMEDGNFVHFIIRRVFSHEDLETYAFEAHTFEGPIREPLTGVARTMIEALMMANAAAAARREEAA